MPSGTFFTLPVSFPDAAGKETWLAAPLLPNAPRFHAAFPFGEGHAIVGEGPSALAVIDTGGNVVGRFSSERENPGAWAFGPGGLAIWGSSTDYGLVAIDGRIVVPPWLDGAEDLGHGWVRVIYSGID